MFDRLLSPKMTELISASRVLLSDTSAPVAAVGSSARFSRPRRTSSFASDSYLRGQRKMPTIAASSVQPNTVSPRRWKRNRTRKSSRFDHLERECAIDGPTIVTSEKQATSEAVSVSQLQYRCSEPPVRLLDRQRPPNLAALNSSPLNCTPE